MFYTAKITVGERWSSAWKNAAFRRKMITGSIVLCVVLASFPVFFQFIEQRSGILIHDVLLNWLAPHNMSIPIFALIWSVALMAFIRMARDPYICLMVVWSYIFLSLARMVTIAFIPLDPPVGIIALADPISNTFYGARYVTRDLFFSGHTATMFLAFLCLRNKLEKLFALVVTVIVGWLLLLQHVHYTMDVFCAPLLTWLIYRFSVKHVSKTVPLAEIEYQNASPSWK